MAAEMDPEHQTPSPPTVFKSAFGHSLRTSAPVPVPEHLAHFTAAVLCGQYTFKVANGPGGKLSLELALPDYTAEDFEEGQLVIDEGAKGLGDDGRKMLQQLRATTTPCTMIEQNSRGALKTLFAFVAQSFDAVRSTADLKALKVASVQIVRDTLTKLHDDSENVVGRTIVELDSVLASAETTILSKLVESVQDAHSPLVDYLNKVIQLHKDLEADTTIDSDPPMEGGCCASGGSCCGGNACHDDGDCDADGCHDGDCDADGCHDGDCGEAGGDCCAHNH